MSLGSLLQVKIVFIYVNFDNLSSVGVSRCPISLNGGIFVFSWLFDFNFMSYFYINTLNPTENHYPQWYRKSLTSHNSGKCLWIIHPACVFLQIGVPSLTLLYILDETTISSQVSLKAIGHQWYWSYEYTDRWSKSPTIRYDSYIIPSSEAPVTKFVHYCTDCTWLRCRCFPL